MKKLWPFTFNVVIYAASAFVSPFMVLYYQSLGFTGAQIGVMNGISPLVTFLSAPLWTGFADATRRHRLLMTLAILLGVVLLAVYPVLRGFAPVLLVGLLLSFSLAPVTPFADSAAMFMLGAEKEMYGRIRLGGTIGYGLAATLAGLLVQSHGLRLAFWGSAMLFLAGAAVSQRLAYGPSKVGAPASDRVRALLANPCWLLFLTMAFAGGAAMAALNNYLFSYLSELGANEATMGFALTVGTLSEVPVLFFGDRLLRRFRPYGLLTWSMALTGLRMVLLGASRTPGLVLGVQLLNGVTLPIMWVAGVSYADENAPAGLKATAQGLFGAMLMGLGMAVGGFAGGPLLERVGGRGLYLVFGVAVLATVAIVAMIHGRLPAEIHTSPDVVRH